MFCDSAEALEHDEGWLEKALDVWRVSNQQSGYGRVLPGEGPSRMSRFVVVMPCRLAAELRRLTEVAVVEAADFCTLGERAVRGESDGLPPGASLSSARCVRLW
jgi:hypothetical protein